MEAFKRVLCRLALGMGLHPNCKAEEMSVQVLINYTTQLSEGQRQRIQEHARDIPSHPWDTNFQIVRNRAGAFESAVLFDPEAPKTLSTKDWFNAFDLRRMHDHELLGGMEGRTVAEEVESKEEPIVS
jgi:hypothetical protein